jgi:hypothetical protein
VANDVASSARVPIPIAPSARALTSSPLRPNSVVRTTRTLRPAPARPTETFLVDPETFAPASPAGRQPDRPLDGRSQERILDLVAGLGAGVVGAPVVIVFTGLPGTGKSTLAEAVARRIGAPAFAGDWLLGALAPHGVLSGTGPADLRPGVRRPAARAGDPAGDARPVRGCGLPRRRSGPRPLAGHRGMSRLHRVGHGVALSGGVAGEQAVDEELQHPGGLVDVGGGQHDAGHAGGDVGRLDVGA